MSSWVAQAFGVLALFSCVVEGFIELSVKRASPRGKARLRAAAARLHAGRPGALPRYYNGDRRSGALEPVAKEAAQWKTDYERALSELDAWLEGEK
jgi:hypothetical protein